MSIQFSDLMISWYKNRNPQASPSVSISSRNFQLVMNLHICNYSYLTIRNSSWNSIKCKKYPLYARGYHKPYRTATQNSLLMCTVLPKVYSTTSVVYLITRFIIDIKQVSHNQDLGTLTLTVLGTTQIPHAIHVSKRDLHLPIHRKMLSHCRCQNYYNFERHQLQTKVNLIQLLHNTAQGQKRSQEEKHLTMEF